MYARSYEKNTQEEEMRPLPMGYSGVAFESEAAEPPPPIPEPSIPTAAEASAPLESESASAGVFPSFLSHIPFLQKIKLPFLERPSFGSLFSDTEDLLLLGLALLLLFSKEGDSLCAIAVLILLFTGKD